MDRHVIFWYLSEINDFSILFHFLYVSVLWYSLFKLSIAEGYYSKSNYSIETQVWYFFIEQVLGLERHITGSGFPHSFLLADLFRLIFID